MKVTMILLALISTSTQAEVYKCKNAVGGMIYQQKPCVSNAQGSINIKPFDQKKIDAAQKDLTEKLKQDQAIEAAAAEVARKEAARPDVWRAMAISKDIAAMVGHKK
jgi:cytochrome c556